VWCCLSEKKRGRGVCCLALCVDGSKCLNLPRLSGYCVRHLPIGVGHGVRVLCVSQTFGAVHGGRCRNWARKGHLFCWAHDPKRADEIWERKRGGKRTWRL